MRAEAGEIVITLMMTAPIAQCPNCQQWSQSIHSRYVRHLSDLPWGGVPVRIELQVRRFRCSTPDCCHHYFTERVPEIAPPYRRRTNRFQDWLSILALAFGGEPAIRACAEIIVKCAPIEPNGFANLQFAALANVKAGAPFLPAAYHDKDKPAFAIATESADLAVQAFENARSIEEGRNNLIGEIEKHGKKLAEVAKSLRVKFYGIDFSLAPFPDDAHSLGNAVEKMGIPKIGLHGSLAAAAILTEAIDRANFPHTGFSGFMQPVLEDSVLAKRAAEGTLTIKDVLLYSAVCGTGLDTIPLQGDTTSARCAQKTVAFHF
jgi:hypothetical protein